MVLSRVAEPENLKTVPVPTFDLITVPVPAPVPGHIHAYKFTNTYTVHLCVHFRKRTRIHILKNILIQNIYIYMWRAGYTPGDRLTSWVYSITCCTVQVYKLLFIRQ